MPRKRTAKTAAPTDNSPGEWSDPAAERFVTAADAVALLEQNAIYLGENQESRLNGPDRDENIYAIRFIG